MFLFCFFVIFVDYVWGGIPNTHDYKWKAPMLGWKGLSSKMPLEMKKPLKREWKKLQMAVVVVRYVKVASINNKLVFYLVLVGIKPPYS